MNVFQLDIPTLVVFGRGEVNTIGRHAAAFGSRALLVTTKGRHMGPVFTQVKQALAEAGVEFAHFDGVTPNPTTEEIKIGADMAKAHAAQVIIGLGGGSAMDSAKAIAVEASHPGAAWDYLHYKTPPSAATLPIICVGTTSGTGSQVTQCAVLTDTKTKDKSAIWHRNIFPKVAIVDPNLMLTLPRDVTAATGFDAFAHCFEAYLSVNTNPVVEVLALEGMRSVIEALPVALADGSEFGARERLALADTLGGLCIATAGVTLPHGLGMQISGHCPDIAHGVSLALTYPEFMRFTLPTAQSKFATLGRLFDSTLSDASDEVAAIACCERMDAFLRAIGLWVGFKGLGVSREQVLEIAACGQVLGDYKNNPRVASLEEMTDMLLQGYER